MNATSQASSIAVIPAQFSTGIEIEDTDLDTEDDERERAVEDFQNANAELRFFVGNPRTGGYGLTLTAAHTVIYYSNSFDLEVRLQSEDRAHRIGQTEKVTYVDLIAKDTVDEHIVKALRNKIDIASQVLGENFKDWII